MSVRTIHENRNSTYFISFTCHQWIPLIAISNQYEAFYSWFRYLKKQKIPLIAYVIMPNHFHAIIHNPMDSPKSINKIIANGKRFIAYEIVKALKGKNDYPTLNKLSQAVSRFEKQKNQKHKVFIPSFDCKEIFFDEMFYSKLDYIHFNPVRGKWSLVQDYVKFKHSSAAFYELEERNDFVTHFGEVFGDE